MIAWEEATNGAPWHKAIDIKFLANMDGDFCMADYVDSWGRAQQCIRVDGHTGRHLAADYGTNYPTAVWS